MVTLVEFVARLVTSAIDLLRIMLFDVAVSDPLSAVVWATGMLLMTVSLLALGLLVLGMVGELLGLTGRRSSGPPARPGE